MATVTQLYEIVNSVAKQSLGMTDLAATNASFVEVGKAVFDNDKNVSAWQKTLLDRIARTAICVDPYEGDDGGLRKEGIEWGAALQRIYIDIPNAEKNTTWNSATDEHSDNFRKRPLAVEQALFSGVTAWEFDGTIPDVQLQTAFLSPEGMAAYINGIHVAMNNSVELSYENTANLCRAAFVARSMPSSVNLLTEYNKFSGVKVAAKDALKNKEFLRYSAYLINRYVQRMSRISRVFNQKAYATFTKKNNLAVTMHGDFADAADYFMLSDIFHENLVKLPKFFSVPYWQGSGKNYAFSDSSAINITIGGSTVVQSGIVCVLHDVRAMGTTIDKRRMKVSRHELDEYTTYAAKATIGYYNDMHFNGVVFYIEDETEPEPPETLENVVEETQTPPEE